MSKHQPGPDHNICKGDDMATRKSTGVKEESQPRRIDPQTAIHLWTEKLYSANMIAKEMGFSRYGIIKCLNKYGIDTSKNGGVWVKCSYCGKQIKFPKFRARKNEKTYCNQDCYLKDLHNPGFVEWRQGTRRARKVVEKVFDIQPEHIPHHIDGDQRNNNIDNLMVFESSSDHHKWHRLDNPGIIPIFNGRTTDIISRTIRRPSS